MDALETDGCLVGEVKMHEWTNPMLRGLIKWERALVQPTPDNLQFSDFGNDVIGLLKVHLCHEYVSLVLH